MDLAAGERNIDESVVRTSLVLFWLKTRLTLTNLRLFGSVPNTMLVVIPLGRKDITQPLSRISNVSFETKFHVIRFVLGLLIVLTGLVIVLTGLAGITTNVSSVVWLIVGLIVLGLVLYVSRCSDRQLR